MVIIKSGCPHLKGDGGMKTTKEIVNVLEEFSKIFNLTPLWSTDIGQWWCRVVNEMDIWQLCLLRDHNVFGRYDNKPLNSMNDMIFKRIEELEIANN